jgi:hypothetical protein
MEWVASFGFASSEALTFGDQERTNMPPQVESVCRVPAGWLNIEKWDEAPGTVVRNEKEVPTAIEVGFNELHTLSAHLKEGTPIFPIQRNGGVVLVSKVSEIPHLEVTALTTADTYFRHRGISEEYARQIAPFVKAYAAIMGLPVVYLGADEPLYNPPHGCILIQERPLLPLPYGEFTCLGVPVEGYQGSMPVLKPIRLDNQIRGYANSNNNALYLMASGLNEDHQLLFFQQLFWSFLWTYTPSHTGGFHQQLTAQFSQAFVEKVPEHTSSWLEGYDLIASDLAEEVEQRYLSWLESFRAQNSTMETYLNLRTKLSNVAVLQQEASRIGSLVAVRGLYPHPQGFRIITDPVWCTENNRVVNIGTYEIRLDFTDRELPVRVHRLQGGVDGWSHPNFYEGICEDPGVLASLRASAEGMNLSQMVQTVIQQLFVVCSQAAKERLAGFALPETSEAK